MKITKNRLAFALLAGIILTATWAAASENLSAEIGASITRLHILANSNTEADQALKLKVRDCLLQAAKNRPESLSDEAIAELCREEIEKNGYDYEVQVLRGKYYFPRKHYENITLPAGKYQAVRIIIGKGAGENWWCVMYPPLCFSGEGNGALNREALKTLKDSMSPESFSAICEGESITIKPGFKLLELWQELKASLTA